jgi:sphingomyelin phosphodiesterase acid-like 3
MAKLMDGFVSDHAGSGERSLEYQKFFYAGDPMSAAGLKGAAKAEAMKIVWPLYACAMTQGHAAGFRACACPTKP